ncbi:LPS export ABC transporter permease LptG [uncultured Shewanella sp.]|uniref:LPS export ABC transporter permease LptG n=1 Tax=uncultured Shewanella sp. TaxID=173975 RepID=UPI00260C8C06|nr:LPS export ABC transporter permease LptG [uncultured Shewanella sp.]
MRILDFYIARTIISSSALCLLILTGLSGIIKWVDQLRLVGRGTYTMLDAGIYVLYLIPRDVEMFFPMAVLLGALIGMGMMASNSELVVMQSSGLSRLQIAMSAMKTAIPLMVLVMMLGEWGAPAAELKAKERQAIKTSGGSFIKSKQGIWARDDGLFVNIGQVVDVDKLSNVTLYQFDDTLHLIRTVNAQTATYVNNLWQLHDVETTSFTADKIKVNHEDNDVWRSTLTPDKLTVVSVKPESLSIQGLLGYLDYLKTNHQAAERYELALWRKLMQPVTVAVMMLVALSFVFGPLRTATMGARVLLGVVAGFSFYICSEIFGPLSIVYGLPAYLSAGMPALIFSVGALYFIRK